MKPVFVAFSVRRGWGHDLAEVVGVRVLWPGCDWI